METKEIVNLSKAPDHSKPTDKAGSAPKGMFVEHYLLFGGRCEEALAFYGTILDVKIKDLMLNKDNPEPPPAGMIAAGFEDKVLHTVFTIGDTTLMAADGMGNEDKFGGFSLALTVPTAAELDRVVAALSKDGKVIMPAAKTFWTPRFAMLTDRFGLSWMIGVPA